MTIKEKQFVEEIISALTRYFSVPFEEIIRQVRKKKIVEARQALAYCLRLMTKMSFPEIGRLLGGRDHTTAMHSCSKIAEKIEKDRRFGIKMEGALALVRTLDIPDTLKYPETKIEVVDLKKKDFCGGEQLNFLQLGTESAGIENENDFVEPAKKKQKEYKIPTINLELSSREKQFLNYYRSGKTFQEISKIAGITRQRVQQLTKKAMLKEIGVKKMAGFEIDANEYIRGEKLAGKLARFNISDEEKQKFLKEYISKATLCTSVDSFARDMGISSKKLINAFPEVVKIIERNLRERNNRWSRFYIKCRGCGTTTIPHRKRGYCEKCLGSRSKRTRKLLLGHNSLCSVCSIDRGSAVKKYGRDFYITREGRILCRGCFLQLTGRALAKSSRRRHD